MKFRIPTAKEFLQDRADARWLGGYDNVRPEDLIEFATLHVQAALKAVNEQVYLSTYSGEIKGRTALGSGNNGNHPIVEINKDSILNAYPLENIK